MRVEPLIISGALAMGYAVAGLFFLSFWSRTKDRLFVIFASAFWMRAIQRLALVAAAQREVDTTWIYALRLLAFLLMLWAIVDKNRAGSSRTP